MTRPAPLDGLADALAVYRLTRLVTADTITEPLRDRFVEAVYASAGRQSWGREYLREHGWAVDGRGTVEEGGWSWLGRDGDPHPPKLAVLVSCRYCTGVYVGFGVMLARRLLPRAWRPIGDALALSAAGVLIAGLEQD